ncbi:MAG: type II toxin-antitoxin system PemK/MazF family toxin [Chloroflexi bacterium]|nr:type II toxin-antitoxin system PemK/MazF family toxin [Chloroflexota bacterium]
MTGYDQGDIILVPYPFGQRAGGQKRPALVVSPTDYNRATGELIIAQITGRVSEESRTGDYTIEDWKAANLPRQAVVRARLATLETSLVLRRLGKLTEADFRNAKAALSDVLGL